jgi:hypothetical protein
MERITCAAKLRAAARAEEIGLDAEQAVAKSSGITPGAARHQTRLNKKLRNKKKTSEAFAKGKLSSTQANAISDAVDANPDAEDDLLDLAAKSSTADLIMACDRVKRDALDADGSLAERQKGMRSLRTWKDAFGMVCVSGRLTPLVGAKLIAELQRRSDRLFREQSRDKTRVVDAPDQRAADALGEILDSIDGAPSGKRRGPRTLVRLIVSKAAAERGWTEPGEKCETADGTPLPVAALDETFLDADTRVQEVEFDEVDVTTIKTYKRYIPQRLRDGLEAQGMRCYACGSTKGLQIDHADEMRDGGATEIRNLGWLCGVCHPKKTSRDYTLELKPDGTREWVPNKARGAPSRASPDEY